MLADTVTQARHYGATVLLADKYGLQLPVNLRHDLDDDDTSEDLAQLARRPRERRSP